MIQVHANLPPWRDHHTVRRRRTIGVPVALMWFAFGLLLLCDASWGADAGPLIISVPEGFEGPTRNDMQGGVTVAWIKRQPASDGGTLLQVSSIDVGASLDGITTAQRSEATTHYLLEFVKGTGQLLQDFKFGVIERVTLAGLAAARVHWSGTVSGKATVGIMYCVLVHHSVVSLQTQDVGSEATPAMYTAIGAIESVRLR